MRIARIVVPLCLLALGACAAGLPTPRVWREPVTGMELLYVEPAAFQMGSGGPELAGRQDDETLHEVVLTRGFYLGRYEVTQAEWIQVMGDNPSQLADCPHCRSRP